MGPDNVADINGITVMIEGWCRANLLCLHLNKLQNLQVTYSNIEDCTGKEFVTFLGFNLDYKLNA